MKQIIAILGVWCCLAAFAAETIPPAPAQYFNDYAGVVSAGTAAQLNRQLEQYERDASSQIVVAIYPKMESDSSIEDYTVRVAQSWKVGRQNQKNGAVLFIFIQDHKMFLQVGYGLEGVLPDATCKRIIDDEITPAFKAGNFDAGLTAGVNAILAAAKGEYKGTGRTVSERRHEPGLPAIIGILFVVIFVLVAWSNARRGGYYSRRGWSGSGWGGGWSSGGGGWSSGGSSGGFSGDGGSFGGGGAGGSW